MSIIPERSHFVSADDPDVQDFLEPKRGKTYVIKYDHDGNIQDAYEDKTVRDAEMWKNYVKYELSENNHDYDEMLREEQALYENGYISFSELYFGHNIESGDFEV